MNNFTGKMDCEVLDLCRALNAIPGIRTSSSCGGHAAAPLRIWMKIETVRTLNIFLWAGCFRWWGWRSHWKVELDTADPDRDTTDISVLLESTALGEEAYRQAELMAKGITQFLEEEGVKRFPVSFPPPPLILDLRATEGGLMNLRTLCARAKPGDRIHSNVWTPLVYATVLEVNPDTIHFRFNFESEQQTPTFLSVGEANDSWVTWRIL